MNDLDLYRVTVQVQVIIRSSSFDDAMSDAKDVVNDALVASGMSGPNLRMTGIATNEYDTYMVARIL